MGTGKRLSTAQGSRRAQWSAHALVSASVGVCFARAIPYPLQTRWDDGRFVVDNSDVHQVSAETLWSIVSQAHFQAYHPLHLLSYWLDVPWAGARGPVLHAVSLALWIVAANVLLRFVLRAGLSLAAAVLATLVVALHPVQVEAVSWATGRKDVLALLFAATCGLWHLRANGPWDRYSWASRGAFLFAALSKTSVLTFPLVLLLHDVLVSRRRLRPALLQQLPAFSLAAALGLGVLAIWREAEMVRVTAGGLAELPARVSATFAHQLATALWPAANAPMYSAHVIEEPGAIAWASLPLFALVLWLARHDRRVLFGLSAFGVLMLPVSNAVPMYFPLQDRYLSLPLIGLGFAFAALLDPAAARLRRQALVWGAVAALALAARTVQYQGAWRSERSLWQHAVSTQPDAFYAWLKLGEIKREEGDLQGAVRAYRRLVELAPRRKLGHAALLQALALRDEAERSLAPSRAEEYAQRYYGSLEDPEALRMLAGQMLRSGHLRALELPLQRSLTLAPLPDALLERAARTHLEQGRTGLARFYVRQMREASDDPALRALR